MSEHLKTLPWTPDQLCRVNGYPLVYDTMDGRVLTIVLPGGEKELCASATLRPRRHLPAELIAMGMRYEPPRVVRKTGEGVA